MNNTIDLTPAELEKLAEYLQKNIGIHLEAQKLLRFKRKIEEIFYRHKIENFSTFYHKLRFLNSEELIQDLTNAVTVNETYFWREHEQFELLSKEILPQFIKSHSLQTVRILVSPCSSGEELYSIMLSILDTPNLIEKLNIEMVGIDIDSTMIQKAKTGLYSKRSVDKLPKHLLEKYFKKVGTLYKIDRTLTDAAKFLQVNIFDDNLKSRLGEYDILFSRNMLIYFNAKDKQRCFETFWSLMKQDAKLFLGHADANNIDKKLFAPVKNGFHVFRKIA